MFSNENVRFSASYPPSPESSKKKNFPTAAVIVAFRVPEIKKTKNRIKLEYIFYTMTFDCKKNSNATKWQIFGKKIKILLKNLIAFALEK